MQSFSMSCDSSMIRAHLPEFKLWVLPLVFWIDGFSQSGYCMPHSLGLIKNRTDLFSGFWERCQRQQAEAFLKTNSSIFYISIHFVGMQYDITLGNP